MQPDRPSNDTLLAEAHEAAASGRAAQAIAIARAVLETGVRDGDEHLQARAMVTMANCELRVIGQFRSAYEHAQRAVFLFERAEDIAGQCAALGTLAIAATHLAHHEDAVESGLLGVRLAATLNPGRDQVMAHHCLGLASYYGKNFDQATQAYESACAIARSCEPPLNTFQLHVNQATNECLRYFNERSLRGDLPSLARLSAHVEDCDRLLQGNPGNISLTPASHWNNLVIHLWAAALLAAWSADLDGAVRRLDALQAWSERIKQSWLAAAVSWAQAELAIARGDPATALHWARDMQLVADYYGHEALCVSSHQLAIHIHELQAAHDEALAEVRRMIRREQRARAESLRSRARVIDWQIELREQKRSVKRLELTSGEFERLALQDPLTRLANRRQFDARFRSMMAANTSATLFLAMVDVDRFKQVNDEFSHAVGDAVLSAIAQVLQSHVRATDLPARLGGDEFAVAFHAGSATQAEQLCDRIRDAVRGFDWPGIAPGLGVSVSIGLSQPGPGDSLETCMDRSDAAMYSSKRAGRPA